MSKLALPVATLLSLLSSCADHKAGRLGDLVQVPNVLFRSRVELPIGVQRSVDVAVDDLDGDDIPDLAAADLAGHVVLKLGQGNGGFVDAGSLDVSGKPIAIYARDLDLDNDLDLVVVSADANVATSFLNDGQAHFTQAQQFAVQELPTSVAVGDFNGDDLPDLIITHLSRSDVLMFFGQGDGTFTNPFSISIPRGSRTAGLLVADVNEDGVGDVVFCDTDNDRVVILFGTTGTEGFNIETVDVDSTPIALSVGDLNGDERADIVVSCFGDDVLDVVEHFKGYGVSYSIQVSGSPANSTIGDVDGDGVQDIAVCVLNRSAISIMVGGSIEGVSNFTEYQLPTTGIPYRPLLADLAGDSRPDLAVVSTDIDRMNVYPRSDTGLHCERTVLSAARTSLVTEGADLDGDGQVDIVTCGEANPYLSILVATRSQTGQVLEEAWVHDLGNVAEAVAVGDVDGDGKPDLLVALDHGVKLLANHSVPGSFDFQEVGGGILVDGLVPAGLALADVTGDGFVDVVVGFLADEKVVVLPGAGNLTFGTPVETAVAGSPTGIAVADFDRDGQLEIAVARAGTSQVDLFDVAADGRLISPLHVDVGPGPLFLRVADFNRDGRPDLAVNCVGDDSVRMLVGQAAGGFRSTRLSVPGIPTNLTVGDLDLDGNPDLVVVTLQGVKSVVLLGDGRGSVKSAVAFPGVYAATAVVLADVIGSDLPDLIVGSHEIDRVVVFENDSVRVGPQ